MARFVAMLLAAAFLLSTAAVGQDSTAADDGPDWINDDSVLVERPSWISATVAKDIVELLFRPGTSAAQRAAIIKRVHGTGVHHDHQYGNDGYYYLRVASHPDACGVKQALDVLDSIPEVAVAVPHMPMTMSGDGGLSPVSAMHKGSARPCPIGTGLLR